MNISNELLAAYAEGNVSNDERNAVRQYLAENPQELESVMMMMDEDYDLEPDNAGKNDFYVGGRHGEAPFHDIALSAAAFAPQTSRISHNMDTGTMHKNCFDQQLNALLDEIMI